MAIPSGVVIFAGPLAWFAELNIGYALAAGPCFRADQRLAVPNMRWAWSHAGLLGLALVCMLIALWGVALGGGSFVSSLLTGVGLVVLPRCGGQMSDQFTRRVLRRLPGVALLLPALALAQTMPAAVPADEVFTREQIGHALSPPTPAAGRTAPSVANAPADDGQWTMPSKNYASTRYSSLTEITPQNVARLVPQFSFSLAVNKGQEAAPIIADNVMYVVTAYPNIVYALDLSKSGAPMKWRFAPKPLPASQGVACCDVVNRGGTVDRGKFIFNTLDGQTIAVDIRTGKPIWRTRLGNINIGETLTMAPLVADGRVFVGDSGGEMGVRGWLAALDEDSGKLLWRAYNTGPMRM